MKVLGIIPARGGSKAVPSKNIKYLGGKPLIAYTIETVKKSKLTKTIVSTDDKEIADISNEYGVETPFTRTSELASDDAKAIPVIQHALNFMEETEGTRYDAVMMLQPTTPFRRPEDIDKAIDILENSDADSVISVVEVEGAHPARMKYMDGGFLIDPPFCEEYENQPRQELQPMYIRNGAIYLTKRGVLLNGSFKGNNCQALIMPKELSVNIDSEHDFRYAEWLLKEYIQ